MVVPKPPVTLDGHCSVIYDNSLYTFSEHGFASIALSQNATWNKLEPGVPVSGAACVTGAMSPNNGQQALYVVGGTGASDDDYTGLQRYVFDDEKWETITATSKDMSNRTNHGAVFLTSSASIFVYAGNRDGSTTPTSDTFVINTGSPNNVSSYSGADASPASAPILLPWSSDRAALVGGSTSSKNVHLFKFNGTGVWSDSGATLPQALPDGARCSIVNEEDGSKVLESFEMTSSPNKVTSYALVNPGGKPADPAKVVGAPSRKRRRRANMDNYPTYDGQYASSKTWSQYSLAQDVNGKMVAISGGNGRDSLALFNQTSNGWMNATKLFYGDKSMQQILPSPSPSATATPTSSSTPSSTPPAAADGGNSNAKVGTIVGATLGSVIGVAIILIALIFLLKNKKNKRDGGQDGSNDKDRLSIQDQGIEPLTRSAYPMAKSQAPLAASSVDSLAIFSGKLSDEKKTQAAPAMHPVYGRKAGPAAKASPLSTVQSSRELLSGPYTPDADKAFEATATDEANRPGDRRTNEGWSKYFQDDSNPTNLADIQQKQQQPDQQPTADENLAKSERRGSAWPMTDLTPLNFGFLDEPKPLGRVVTGSPTTETSPSAADGRALVIPEGQTARISSGDSISLVSDDNDTDADEYDRSRWTDVPHNDDDYLGRPVSSMYSQSFYNPSANPSARDVSMGPGSRAAASGGSGIYDTVRSSQPRRSSVIIPETLTEGPTVLQQNQNSDMSWLNLNADR